MTRPRVAAVVLVLASLACSLGSHGGQDETGLAKEATIAPLHTSEGVGKGRPTTTGPAATAQQPQPTRTPSILPSAMPTVGATFGPPPSSSVEVVKLNIIEVTPGYYRVYGMVENNAGKALSIVDVTLEALDSTGKALALKTASISTVRLPAGRQSPFSLYFSDPMPVRPADFNIRVDYREAVNLDTWHWDFEFPSVDGETLSDGSYLITGEVKNVSGDRAKGVHLLAVLFDGQGGPIAIGFYDLYGISMDQVMPAGATEKFTFVVAPFGFEGLEVARFELIAEGYRPDP